MESAILTAYNAYRNKLGEFATTLKNRVKAVSSLKTLQEELGLTANMYYQRLKYPANISLEEVRGLAKLLNDDTILQQYNEANELGHALTTTLTTYLKDAKVTVRFICEKLNSDTSNFYRKQKDPRLWKQAEIEKISKIVETMKSL